MKLQGIKANAAKTSLQGPPSGAQDEEKVLGAGGSKRHAERCVLGVCVCVCVRVCAHVRVCVVGQGVSNYMLCLCMCLPCFLYLVLVVRKQAALLAWILGRAYMGKISSYLRAFQSPHMCVCLQI